MRPLRVLAVSLAFVCGSLTAGSAQQTSSSVGTIGLEYDLGEAHCSHSSGSVSGPTKETCARSYQSKDGLTSISGVSGAAANYSGLEIAGNATAAISPLDQNYIAGVAVGADASLTDYLYPQGDSTGTSFLLVAWAVIGNPTGEGTSTIELSVNLENKTHPQGAACGGQNFGFICSTQVQVYAGDTVELDADLSGNASAVCGPPFCGEISTGFHGGYKTPGGGRALVVRVVDSNGNPVEGATVTSASGHAYPSRFASATTLKSNLNPSTEGQPVTFTATVASFGRPTSPNGKVGFTDTTTGTVLGEVYLKAGTAALTTSGLSAGTHAITATYPGDRWSSKSVSSALDQVVY